MTDDAKAGAGPEIPGELWANLSPPPFVPFVCYTSESQARTFADLAGLESRLIGVHPRYRDAFNRLAKRIEALTWFVVKNERGLYEVSDEHSIGEMIMKLAAEVKAFQTKGGQS